MLVCNGYGVKMNELLIIQRFCERRNIKYEVMESNNLLTENILDNVLRISKMTGEHHSPEMSYIIKYNATTSVLSEECDIAYLIYALKTMTSDCDLEECCVCYKLCRADIFKCVTCSAITCNVCLIRDKLKKNEAFIKLMEDLNFSSDRIVSEIAKLKSPCPVCRAEYNFIDLLAERMLKILT